MGKVLGWCVVIVVVLIIIGSLGDGGSGSGGRSTRVTRPAGPTPLSTAVDELLAQGSLHSVDINSNMVRVDPLVWGQLLIEQKQNVVMMLSRYFNEQRGYDRVSVRSNRNDTELATYSSFSGVKILY